MKWDPPSHTSVMIAIMEGELLYVRRMVPGLRNLHALVSHKKPLKLHCIIFFVTSSCLTSVSFTLVVDSGVYCNDAFEVNHGNKFPLSSHKPCATHVLYSCHEGYELDGDPVRICQQSGFLTGSQPQCFLKGKKGAQQFRIDDVKMIFCFFFWRHCLCSF